MLGRPQNLRPSSLAESSIVIPSHLSNLRSSSDSWLVLPLYSIVSSSASASISNTDKRGQFIRPSKVNLKLLRRGTWTGYLSGPSYNFQEMQTDDDAIALLEMMLVITEALQYRRANVVGSRRRMCWKKKGRRVSDFCHCQWYSSARDRSAKLRRVRFFLFFSHRSSSDELSPSL